LWTKDSPSAPTDIDTYSISIVNNKLEMSGNSINPTTGAWIQVASNFHFIGDFDIQVDVDLVSGTAVNRYNGLETYLPAPGFGTYFYINSGDYRVGSTINNWVETSIGTTAPTSMTLRSTRVGTVLTSYYSLNGGPWTVIDTRPDGFSGVAWVHLRAETYASLGTFNNTFDNFTTNVGTLDHR